MGCKASLSMAESEISGWRSWSTIASGSLAAMNWRRGLLLAGINLAVAIPMILMMEARDQKYALTQEEIMSKAARKDPPLPPELPATESHQASPEQAEEMMSVGFDPCTMPTRYPVQVVVVQASEMPSLVLSGWQSECPPPWSLAGRLHGKVTWPPTPFWMETQRIIDAGLCLFVAVQWFLMGGFPLVRPRHWWAEPAAFITACAVVAGAVAMLPVVDDVARLPALIAFFAYPWWFGLLIWRTLQFGWRVTSAWQAPRSS